MVSPTLRRVLAGGLLAVFALPPALLAEEPGHDLTLAALAFTEGVLAFEEGADQVAAEKFRESLQHDPRDGTPRYWLGLTLLRLGQAREAVAELQASLKAPRPARVDAERAAADLSAAQRAAGEPGAAGDVQAEIVAPPEPAEEPSPIDRRPFWEGSLGVALGGDSNPNLLSEELAVPIPGPPPQQVVDGSSSDALSELDLHLRLNPLYRPDGWSAAVSVDARRSFHRDFDYLDLGQMRAFVHLARGADPLGYLSGALGSVRVPFGERRVSALLQGGGGYYQLDGATYLRTWDGAASLILHLTPATSTQLDLVFSDRDFSGGGLGDERRNGQDLFLRLGQSFFFGHRARCLRLAAAAGDRQASREFSASFAEGSAELALPLTPAWSFQLRGSLRKDDYDHEESNLFNPAGPPREDTTVTATAALVWQSSFRLRWTARATRVDRDSNVDLGSGLPDLDYQRSTASLGASWSF